MMYLQFFNDIWIQSNRAMGLWYEHMEKQKN